MKSDKAEHIDDTVRATVAIRGELHTEEEHRKLADKTGEMKNLDFKDKRAYLTSGERAEQLKKLREQIKNDRDT